MATDLGELVRRIETLEARVRSLEAVSPLEFPVAEVAAPEPEPASPPTLGPTLAPSPIPVPSFVPEPARAASAPVAAAEPDALRLERFIGGRFYAVIGAIIVVVGVGLFLRLAVQRGWLSFPPPARCLAAAVFGAALLSAGELARRKAGAFASVGLSAAGIATMYASVLAAFGWYKLVGAVPALVMLAAVSGLGVVVALRANQLVLGLLASVGAHLTPLVLWKSDMPVAVLPAYLLAVLGFGLWLAAVRPNPFAWVRLAVMLGTALVGSMWAERAASGHAVLVLGFLATVWSAVHFDLGLAAFRAPRVTEVPDAERPRTPSSLFVRSVIASLGATIWSLVAGVASVRASRVFIEPRFDWLVPAVLGIACAVLGTALGRGMATLLRPPATDRERLSLLLLVQAGGLLVTAIALGIDGSLQSACWLALGTAAAVGGALIASPPVAGYGFLLLAIAVGRLLVWDSWHLPEGSININGIIATRWSALMLAAGACIAIASFVVRRKLGGGWALIANLAAAVAVVVIMGAAMTPGSRGVSIAIWCAAWSAPAWGVAMLRRSKGLEIFAGAICFFGVAVNMIAQAALVRRSEWVDVGGLIFTRWSVASMMFGGALVFGAWAARAIWQPGHRAANALIAGATGAVMVAPYLAECSGGAVTLWWLWVALVLLGARAVLQQRLALGDIARAVLGLAVLVWFGAYPLRGWNQTDAAVLLHPGLWIAVLACVVVVAAMLWLRATENRPAPAAAVLASGAWCLVGLLLFTATSFEVARAASLLLPGDPTAQNGAVSIWWGIFAGVLLTLGFTRSATAPRRVGLGLLGVATGKAVLFDLQDISPEWRVASFLGLGLLMLGVAVVYARASRRADQRIAGTDV